MEDTSPFSTLPQEEQQELEQTLSQNSKHPSPPFHVDPAFMITALHAVLPMSGCGRPSCPMLGAEAWHKQRKNAACCRFPALEARLWRR